MKATEMEDANQCPHGAAYDKCVACLRDEIDDLATDLAKWRHIAKENEAGRRKAESELAACRKACP